MTIHLGILPALARLLTGATIPPLNLRHTTFRVKPVLKGLALTRDLEDIEGLPFIVFCMALITLNGLAHHAEEEINDRTHVAMRKGGPAIGTLFCHGLQGLIGSRRKGRGSSLLIQGLMKVVKEPDQILVAVVLSGLAKVVLDSVLDGIPNGIEKSHGPDIGRTMRRPHALGQILIGQEHTGGHILLLGHQSSREVFAEHKGVPFGHGPKQLNC
jgi:hypothetical protein